MSEYKYISPRRQRCRVNCRCLTPTILREFVARIDIHAVDKSSGQRVQDIDISYNFIGGIPCTLLHRLAPSAYKPEHWGKGKIDMQRTMRNPYTAA